jgi:hypothetical protein
MTTYPKYVLAGALLALWLLASWLVLRPAADDADGPVEIVRHDEEKAAIVVDPGVKAKFDQIKPGMTLGEVEAIMGKAGPSYSSQDERECYIWKSKNGWISIIVENGKVTTKGLRPELSMMTRR